MSKLCLRKVILIKPETLHIVRKNVSFSKANVISHAFCYTSFPTAIYAVGFASRFYVKNKISELKPPDNPLKSRVSAGSFYFYTDCSLPHRNMGGYFLWPIVRILYSIFECYGAEMVLDTSAMPYINQHKRVQLGRQNEKDIPHSTARMSLYLCFII